MPEHNNARIRYSYPGDGTTKLFPILWPYIDKGFVNVSLQRDPRDEVFEDISGTVRWVSDTMIELPAAPPSGSMLFITRRTPSGKTLTTFHDGSTQLADDLNMVGTQLIHIVQESRDYTEQVHDYTLRAEGMLEQLGGLKNAVNTAEDAAERAEGAADRVGHISNELKTLSIAVDDAPSGHMASGAYNAETGMLTLRVPQGPQGVPGRDGRHGTDGKDGQDGKDGEQGNPGVIMNLKTGMFALQVINGDLILFHDDEDGTTEPCFYLDMEGNLIWEQS